MPDLTGPYAPSRREDVHWGLYPDETCVNCRQPIVMSRTRGWVAEEDLTVSCPAWKHACHAGGGPPRTGQLKLF